MSNQYLTSFTRAVCAFVLLVGLALPGTAQQSPFKTVITVNDQAITQYEIDQRILFLTLLRAPGNLAVEARNGLIDDRLRLTETQRQDVALTEDEITAGMNEFAGRANLDAEQFIAELERAGVSRETFRDFVAAGLAWRTFVRARFGPNAQITNAEIDRALAQSNSSGGARVLLSEIIVPQSPQNAALMQRLSESIASPSAFASAAQRYSASPTRGRGGRLEWLALGQIPPALRGAVLPLRPGQVSAPINLGRGVGIFLLRAIEETGATTPNNLDVDYATVLFPGGRSPANLSAARQLADSIDTCDDLYTPAKTLPPEYFERKTVPVGQVPSDLAVEFARLDINEISTSVTRQNGNFLVFAMLCARTPPVASEPVTTGADSDSDGDGDVESVTPDPRARMRDSLFQQRLSGLAENYLADLRANAIIVER